LYLREASYHQYNYGVWNNLHSLYTVIDQGLDGNWRFAENEQGKSVSISTYMTSEIGVVPLPHGTTSIEDITAFEINKNQYGAVKMEMREGWIDYTAGYGDAILDGPPDASDLDIADNYRNDFDRLARELDLYGKPETEAVGMIERFFSENFTYTLDQSRGRYPRGRYLQGFLFDTRSGHCEYFATSTVLLLRTLGIPARYAVGYVIDEYSPMEGQYIARSRDAHSWVLAWIGNAWRIIDTTPAIWAPLEDENASLLEPLMDLYSWISYRFSLYQSQDATDEEETNSNLLYLLIPLVMVLVWRLFFKQRVSRKTGETKPGRERLYQGRDSGFYDLVKTLNSAGYSRRNGETLAAWLRRVNDPVKVPELEKALALHYRYRFDPEGCNNDIREELAVVVRRILSEGIIPATVETGR
jgi:transglutaminase-like putative cysteine protease